VQAWIDAYLGGMTVKKISENTGVHSEIIRKAIVAAGKYRYRTVSHYRKLVPARTPLTIRKCLDCAKPFASTWIGNRICYECSRCDHHHGVIG